MQMMVLVMFFDKKSCWHPRRSSINHVFLCCSCSMGACRNDVRLTGFENLLKTYIEYPTKVPNTQIRFRWTSCTGTMHQTLITDRGCPKNRYPYNLSVRVSRAKPVGLSIVSLQSCSHLAGAEHRKHLDAHEATALTLADKMLKLPIFRQAQIENTSCKPMMQTFNKKLQKKTQLDRWRRRAQHRHRVLANKIATYNQDDDANSSCSSSSSSTSEWLFDPTISTKNSVSRSCYCRIYTSMKDYQTLITDRGRPNLMMSFPGTVTFVWYSYVWAVGIATSIHEQQMAIFLSKWRANEQQGGGWATTSSILYQNYLYIHMDVPWQSRTQNGVTPLVLLMNRDDGNFPDKQASISGILAKVIWNQRFLLKSLEEICFAPMI